MESDEIRVRPIAGLAVIPAIAGSTLGGALGRLMISKLDESDEQHDK